MFSGIVETITPIVEVQTLDGLIRVSVARPEPFNDLKVGDSICFDGVCLTVENFTQAEIRFALAAETLHITGWTTENLKDRLVNLERSLSYGDRIHGHLVTGHVDGAGRVQDKWRDGESLWYRIGFPEEMMPYFWRKGSVAMNGVSLTINSVENHSFTICLIPETCKRTNLESLEVGHKVMLEVDQFARGLIHWLKSEGVRK